MLTKGDLNKIKGTVKEVVVEAFEPFAKAIQTDFHKVHERLGGIDKRLDGVDIRLAVLEVDVKELKAGFAELNKSVAQLANTLDVFLKRLTAHEEEFEILKSEVATMKKVLKDKFKVDVDVIRHK